MKVAIVAEYYPRKHEPALGIWAHRQALAARDAGADVRVLVLHRPIAPSARAREPRAWREAISQPARAELDGLPVRYVRYLSPPRGRSYLRWGAFAAPPLRLALARLRREFRYDLVHAHYAVPAADAVLRADATGDRVPLVISEHGGDVFGVARRPDGPELLARVFGAARLVIAHSDGIARDVLRLGARETVVVPLGADTAGGHDRRPPAQPTLVTVANLIARKRHDDVLRALWILRDQVPALHYRVVGDGPKRAALEALARELGVADRVEFTGAVPHEQALRLSREATIFVMPSTEEAFGVAYIEAMAAGLPAIGARGEPGPEHLAARTIGMRLVPPGEPELLAREVVELLEPRWGARVSRAAAATVQAEFSWQACGRATVAAYERALEPR